MISRKQIKDMLKGHGAQQVSDDALAIIEEHLADYTSVLAEKCVKLAEHSGRVTVKDVDARAVVEL